METKKVTRYFCEFCRKGRFSKSWMIQHEATCYKNPNRIPYEGELTYIAQTGKMMDFGSNENLPDGMRWLEWVQIDSDKMPSYWPGEGKIYHDGRWHDVPGYSYAFPKGAHGCAGGPAPFDVWPKSGHPEGLHKVPAKSRWGALYPKL